MKAGNHANTTLPKLQSSYSTGTVEANKTVAPSGTPSGYSSSPPCRRAALSAGDGRLCIVDSLSQIDCPRAGTKVTDTPRSACSEGRECVALNMADAAVLLRARDNGTTHVWGSGLGSYRKGRGRCVRKTECLLGELGHPPFGAVVGDGIQGAAWKLGAFGLTEYRLGIGAWEVSTSCGGLESDLGDSMKLSIAAGGLGHPVGAFAPGSSKLPEGASCHDGCFVSSLKASHWRSVSHPCSGG